MIFLAIRQMLARKKQTALILFGITLGTAIYCVIAGMQLGFQDYFIERLVENDAHIKILAHEEEITPEKMRPIFFPSSNDQIISWSVPPYGKRNEAHLLNPLAWFEKLNSLPEVIAYSQQLTAQIIISRGGVRHTGQIVGFIPEKQKKVTGIEKYIIEGKLDAIGNTGRRVFAGSDLLKKIGARVGDTINLSAGSQNDLQPFKIIGSFELGVRQIDESTLYGALLDVQALNGTPGRISQIAVKTDNPEIAAERATQWSNLSYDQVQSWDQLNASFLQVFKIQDIFRIFITTGILSVAAFGIYNVLTIIVNQKKKEVAILRSLGFPPSDILQLFMIQGLVLGMLGAFLGVAIGLFLCLYLTTIEIQGMGRQGLTISFAPSIYVTGYVMAVISSLIAGFLPARAASQMTPMDIIRSEV